MIERSRAVAAGVLVLALATVLAAPRPASAQYFMNQPSSGGNIEGFTVSGKGVVAAKPNRLEIEIEVSASSELSADAIVKFRDAKKRLQEAFAALKLEKIEVAEKGLLVDQKGESMSRYIFFNDGPNKRNKTEVQLTRKLVVRCDDIRSMDEEAVLQLVAKLLDVAQDAGGHVGPKNNFNPYFYDPSERFNTGLVRFILDDLDKLEEQAYEMAVADAESRAKRLAKLSKVKLGPVTAVREGPAVGEKVNPFGYGNTNNSDDDPKAKRSLESSKYQEIPVRVELLVRFDVAGANAPVANRGAGDK